MNTGSSDTSLHVGEKIKRLRQGAGWSVEQLAERAGLESDELERIEREMLSPTLGVLTKICDGLGVRLGRFFDLGPRKYYALVRSSDEKVVTRVDSKDGAGYGYEYTSLGFEKRERVMEPFLITISPPSDASEMEKPSTHDGEEFIYVLEGELEIQLQDEHFLLQSGDSIYYDASVPHRVLHRGQGPAKMLAVIHLPRKT
jgi:transcriptional regulator with XRE-family HTH domain